MSRVVVPRLGVYRTCTAATLPTQATDRAQCIDLYAAEAAKIRRGETVVVDLGIKIVIPHGYGLEFRERSGLASRGVIIGAGVIDEDYHGPLKAVVRYMGGSKDGIEPINDWFTIAPGDKIVQAELVKRIQIDIEEIDLGRLNTATDSSARGEKGFGSTG